MCIRDRQWNAQARHSLRAGSLYSAGGVAGSAEALGPDVLQRVLGKAADLGPVSYTHLDVYKRQGLLLIAILTYVNVVGLRWGTLLQNLSTWTKFAAMAAFVFLGFAIGKGDWSHFHSHGVGLTMGLHPTQLISAFGLGLIAVYWAYDGWVYITWVAGEVKEPRRNVPLAMVLGVLTVGAIYMAMNITYLYALPLTEIVQHETIAHAAAAALFSPHAALWLSLMIAVSCFSAAATCTLSGARVYLAMAQDLSLIHI